jgi:hypothetical protein
LNLPLVPVASQRLRDIRDRYLNAVRAPAHDAGSVYARSTQANFDWKFLHPIRGNPPQAFPEMTMATRSFTIVAIFARPFILNGFDRIAPAGAYTVDVEEECSGATAAGTGGWRQVRMSIRLESDGTINNIPVDPTALIAAMQRDGAQETQERRRKGAKARRHTARTRKLSWAEGKQF